MDRKELIKRIKEGKYTQEQLIGWVGAVSSGRKKPDVAKVGDVFHHSVFLHPYVLLKKTETGWICTLLTSEEKCPEILEPCKSRFFSDNFITKALFTVSELHGSFVGTFENNRQLKEVYSKLLKEFLVD